MRNLKLFMASLAIALCGFSQAFAADWSAATLEAGKHYFLNVGANKWWGAGNSWGTQASLLPHPEYLTVIADGSNYKIESQVSNGGTDYYFNGSYMDNGSPVSLTIETDGTNYSIANGTTYYGYDGSSTVLATSDNRDSDNFKWQIFSEAQMRARLEAASSSNPVDATYLILNQGFGRNNRNTGAWTMDASNKNLAGGDNTNLCAESYHSIFTLSQKIENVPNGLYTLTAQGFYRQDGSDNDNLPYFYINDAKGTFPILSGSENNMTDASNSFTAGKYTISPISVLVTDGTITLGAKNEVNTSLWCIFDNFTLTFYGDTDPLEASKTLIKATIDEAEAIDVTGLPTAVVDEMKAIVETYKTAYESYTTQAEFDQAIVAIQAAINKVKAYNNAKDCVAKLKALLEETNVYTQEAYETIYANVTKFENAELTVDEANAMNGAIFGTGWRSTAAIDDFLISAWDVDARNWDSYHVNTWSTIGDSGNPNMFTPCIEYWTGDGDKLADKVMTATVAGLAPNVKYSVSILACPAVNTGENGVAPTGIELQVGEGTPVSLCTGARIAETRFYEGTFTAEGTADAEGNLVIKINVASTNASWLTFRNVKYEAVPEVATWKDIKVDFTNGQILTDTETEIISVGIKMNEDGTATRVAADDASANAIVTGKFHSGQHGLSNFSATVKVEGPVKIGMGSCAWGGNVTVKDENGVEVANAFNTNNGACWSTKDGADKNVIYTYYKGEAATLTIAGGSYTPYFSVEKIALEDIPQVMKVNYSLGESGATGILPANFELDGGKTFTLPVNRTLYVEGKTLKGWTDGTKTYAIGEEVTAVADTEISFAPVFTDNTVSLADRKDTVNIVWDFQQKNGAPVVAVQGKTMFWIAQAVVNGDTIDVKMDIDATSGKVANGNWTDWAQINGGTKLTIPAAKGAVISMESYSATTTTTIAGEVINQGTTKPVYTYTGEEATVDIVIGDGSYWRTVAVAIPAVPLTEVASISALKDVAEGVEVKLVLNNAVVNLWCGDYTTQSMASYIEDATGAIKFDTGLSNMEWMRDSIAMNGYIYATYGKDYDGIPQLSVSDSTGASKVDTVAAVPTSKVMTVADASNETALSCYVKFEKVEFVKKVVDDWGTSEYYLVQGTDTIMFFDKFSRFGWNAMPDFKSFDEVQGFISMYDGKFEFYPYGEYKANYTPAVVVENIAAAKAVENGTNVNLTLKDAKITAYLPSKYGGSATAFIEDESGAIQISGDVLSAVGVESNNMILNGNMYVKYVNEWGAIQLSAGDSLAYSNVEAKEGVVEPTTMAVKDIKVESNVARYVEIANPIFKLDTETYNYIAVQNGDTISVVDNFGWMNTNFEMDDNYNLILPDSVTSINGIVMWDDYFGYTVSVLSMEEYVAPQDIVVNVTEGDIAAAVETAKAAVKKVGKITINLTEGAAYTVNSSIVAPASLVINGNGATVDASALGANFIQSAAASEVITVDSIVVLNVTVKGLGKALYYSAGKNIGISNFVVDNSVIEMAKDVVVFDFTKGSAALNFAVKNSTIYSATATTKSIYSSQGGEKGDAYGATADAPQTFSFENSTLYNIAYNKNFFTHRQGGQKWLKFVVKNNVIVNSGKANFMTSLNGGQDSANPQYDVTTNSVGSLADGVYTDLSASQTVQSNVMGTLVTTNPDFKDAANGDFTVGAGSDQAKEKIGDPRWLVEYDNTATAIEGVNATIMNNGDIYTINGVKVRNAGDSLKGLAKGLYIINGKKLIVK